MGQITEGADGEAGSDGAAPASQSGRDAGARGLKATQAPLRPMVVIEDGRKLLRVGGVIQSVQVDHAYEPDIWDAMLPRERPEQVLILGLGGGTMAQLLTARFGPLAITGVERDPAVVWLARHEFGLAHLPHLRIVEEDAFTFVRRASAQMETRQGKHVGKHPALTYDAICVDLYTAGKMAHGVFDPVFLRSLGRILAPGGTTTFNLWRSPYVADQLRRLQRAFALHEVIEVGDNLVARSGHHAR